MQLKGIIQASYVLGRNCGVLIANDDQNKISLIASLEGYSGAFSFCGTRKTFANIQHIVLDAAAAFAHYWSKKGPDEK